MTSLLSMQHVIKRFGGLAAVSDLSIDVAGGELVGLIGPNGAGKTTVFNLLTGIYAPTEGEIIINRKSVRGLKPFQIARLGAARTFQNIRLFRDLTALENVEIAADVHGRSSLLAAILRTPGLLKNDSDLRGVAIDMLDRLQLSHIAGARAGDLPYGLQRRLEIARALATRPQVLLLDEPAAGMNPQEKIDLMQLIRDVRDMFGLTILLIEHDMRLVMGICERIYVLDYGRIIAAGPPEAIRKDPVVIAAYLGEDTTDLPGCEAPEGSKQGDR